MTSLLIGEVLIGLGAVGTAISALALRRHRWAKWSRIAGGDAVSHERRHFWIYGQAIWGVKEHRRLLRAFEAISSIRDERQLKLLSEEIQTRTADPRAQEQNRPSPAGA
jgi:hypothetical protein